MKSVVITLAALMLVLFASALIQAQETEQDILDRYLNKNIGIEHERLGWVSLNFNFNRINRNNDYNTFATIESGNISGGNLSWLNQAFAIGGEFGVGFAKRFAISVGGEYWLKMTDQVSGSFTYVPNGSSIIDPSSEINVYGGYLGFDYFPFNAPTTENHLTNWALRLGTTVGFYSASWDLWPEFQNLNLSTGLPTTSNTTFKGSAPAVTFELGAEYPMQALGLTMSANLSYLYLNFTNVAWYNSTDQEVVVTTNGSETGRVDLDLSGFRGGLELKRYFNW